MPKIALVQTACSESPSRNIDNSVHMIREAAGKGANIIILQELFQTIYFCREINPKFFQLAEPIPGPVTVRLSGLAKELGIVLVVPLFEKGAPGLYYNSLVVIDTNGSITGVYRKMHIPDDPGFYEKYYFTPGDKGYQVFRTEFGVIGTLICWDQWFPEAARITAMMGAELIVYPTAIATLPDEGADLKKKYLDAWQIMQRSHAIANGCYVAAVNRVGKEGDTNFWGHSFLAGPFGELIAEAGDEEEILTADANFEKIEKERQTWPFFRDRRIDSYRDILSRWKGE
jgi:N-carbamoylputrescine amidase